MARYYNEYSKLDDPLQDIIGLEVKYYNGSAIYKVTSVSSLVYNSKDEMYDCNVTLNSNGKSYESDSKFILVISHNISLRKLINNKLKTNSNGTTEKECTEHTGTDTIEQATYNSWNQYSKL